MADALNQRPKYNITLSQLIRRIIELSQEEQEKLLRHIETRMAGNDDSPERAHQRKNCLIAVDYAFNGRACRNFVQDISSGGMFIETRDKFTIGQDMTFAFTFAAGRPFKCRGEVAWACGDGIGIRFRDIPQLQENILRATINAMPECKPAA
jgi:Tfp pilus assembly protein PilZ